MASALKFDGMSNANLEDKPPVFKSWRGWYWLVLGALAIQIIFYYWLTTAFSQ